MALPKTGVRFVSENLRPFLNDLASADKALKNFQATANSRGAGSFGAQISQQANIAAQSLNTLSQQAGKPLNVSVTGTEDVVNKVGLMGSAFTGLQTIATGALLKIGASVAELALRVPGQIASLFGDAIGEAGNLEYQIAQISIQPGVTASLEQIKETLLEISLDPNLAVGFEDAGLALLTLSRNQTDIAQSGEEYLRSAVLLQNQVGITGNAAEYRDAARVVARAGELFGLTNENIIESANQIPVVIGSGFRSITDYAFALSNAGGVAASLNIPFEEFNLALASTADSFSTGRTDGTAFASFLRSLVPKTDTAREAFEEFNFDFFDDTGTFIGFTNVVEQLRDRFADLNDEDRLDAINRAFGVTSGNFVNALLAATEAEVAEKKALLDVSDAQEKASKTANTLNRRLETFIDQIQALGSSFGAPILEPFKDVLLASADALQALAPVTNEAGKAVADFIDPFAQGAVLFLEEFATSIEDGNGVLRSFGNGLSAISEPIKGIVNLTRFLRGEEVLGVLGNATFLRTQAQTFLSFGRAFQLFSDDLANGSQRLRLISGDRTLLESVFGDQRGAINLADLITIEYDPSGLSATFNGEQFITGIFSDTGAGFVNIADYITFEYDPSAFSLAAGGQEIIKGFLGEGTFQVDIGEYLTLSGAAVDGAVTLALNEFQVDVDVPALQSSFDPLTSFFADLPDQFKTLFEGDGLDTAGAVALIKTNFTNFGKAVKDSVANLFGEEGAVDITLPESFSENVTKITEQVNKFVGGLIPDDLDIPSFTEATTAIAGVFTTIGQTFNNLPPLPTDAQGYVDAVKDLLDTTKELIDGLVVSASDPTAATGLFKTYTEFVGTVIKEAQEFGATLSSTNAEELGASFGSFVGTFLNAVTTLNEIAPDSLSNITSVIGDIAAGILAFATGFAEGVEGGDIAQGFSNLAVGLIDELTEGLVALEPKELLGAAAAFVGALAGAAGEALEDPSLTDVGASFGRFVTTVVNTLSATLSDPKFAGDLGQGFSDLIVGITTGLTSILQGFASESEDSAGAIGLVNAFDSFVENFLNGVARGLRNAEYGELAKAFFDGLYNAVLGIFGSKTQVDEVAAAQTTQNALAERQIITERLNELGLQSEFGPLTESQRAEQEALVANLAQNTIALAALSDAQSSNLLGDIGGFLLEQVAGLVFKGELPALTNAMNGLSNTIETADDRPGLSDLPGQVQQGAEAASAGRAEPTETANAVGEAVKTAITGTALTVSVPVGDTNVPLSTASTVSGLEGVLNTISGFARDVLGVGESASVQDNGFVLPELANLSAVSENLITAQNDQADTSFETASANRENLAALTSVTAQNQLAAQSQATINTTTFEAFKTFSASAINAATETSKVEAASTGAATALDKAAQAANGFALVVQGLQAPVTTTTPTTTPTTPSNAGEPQVVIIDPNSLTPETQPLLNTVPVAQDSQATASASQPILTDDQLQALSGALSTAIVNGTQQRDAQENTVAAAQAFNPNQVMQEFIAGSFPVLDWSTYVPNLFWTSYVNTLNWTAWVTDLSWGDFVPTLIWQDFIERVNLNNFVIGVDLADFIANTTTPDPTTPIPAFASGTKNQSPLSNFASGTDYYRGGAAIGGEFGPELYVTPSGQMGLIGANGIERFSLPAGSAIYDANKTRALLGGATNNLVPHSDGALGTVRPASRVVNYNSSPTVNNNHYYNAPTGDSYNLSVSSLRSSENIQSDFAIMGAIAR